MEYWIFAIVVGMVFVALIPLMLESANGLANEIVEGWIRLFESLKDLFRKDV